LKKEIVPAERWKDSAKKLLAAGIQSAIVKVVLKHIGLG
jgi:hypothetical protein